MTSPFPPDFSPSSPEGRLLATVWQLINEGRFAEAIAPMTEAALLQPDNVRLHTDLGRLYLEAGRPEGALEALRRAISLDQANATAWWRQGIALQVLGDGAGAMAALEQAVSLQPSLADAHYRLGLLLEDQGRPQEALECYRLAARATTEKGARQFIQARVFVMEGREAEAEALLRRAIALQPEMAMAHGLLGEILAGSGRFEEAGRCYAAELAASPRAVSAYYNLVRCRKITPADEDLLKRMDAALERDDLNDYNRSNLQLARGKAFDDLGRYDRAMEAWDEACAARARMFPFDIGAFESRVDSIVALFSAAALARHAASGSDERRPVLILGMPRSGTTLCEQIVSSHPQVAGAGELAFWGTRLQRVLREGLEDRALAEYAAEYSELLRRASDTAAHVTDKQPFNFFSIGLIHLAFPRASIIHCRRSPIDTAVSIHQTHFATWQAFPTGGEELVRYFRAYRRLMAHWREVLPRGRMLEVDYETVTASPETETRKIIGHIGLEWDDICLRPHDNERTVRTPSRWQVRQPINTKSVDRWRRYQPWLGALAALIEDAR